MDCLLKSTVWLKDEQKKRKDLEAEIAKKVVQRGHKNWFLVLQNIYNSDEFGESFVFKIKQMVDSLFLVCAHF